MPTYEYACSKCGEHLEVVQSFKDDPLERCPACRGRLRKVFSPVGIVFKGSGFYKNDSRDSKKAKSGTATDKSTSDTESSTAKADSSSDSSASKTKESTPAQKDKAPAKKESTKSSRTPAATG